ncbi:hypothetical protein NX059_001630 [Plenodomus lindquistii]|nr:hypothetical protein NX059_001630 [Plenodomus lindquistii]
MTMDLARPFEEETLPFYRPEQFYPVKIGQLLDGQFKVLGKLGYGSNSTVWLCRDITEAAFVAIKVCTRNALQAPGVHRELAFYEHVRALKSEHPGQAFLRDLLGTFELSGPSGQHLCLVQPPMHMTIQELQYQNHTHKLNKTLLNWTLFNLLHGLSFLHDDAKVVHADINPSNIMLTIEDESILHRFEEEEAESPSSAKVIDEARSIYGTRKLGLPRGNLFGRPVLCDFGEARIGERHTGYIQPDLYRAPEVLFEMEWTSSVDIWSVATLTWDLFENKHLFKATNENEDLCATHYIAEMVGYLGLPPQELMSRSDITKKVFDEQGRWKTSGGVAVPQKRLEGALSVLDGESKDVFLRFIRSMLEWVPEKRKRASELLEDPWMKE